LRSAAWETAAATGALRLMDIQLVAGLSELYQMQELYKSNIDKVGVGSTDWFDPAFHEAAARKLYLALDELYYDESEVLLPLYKKLQPIVHAAVESK
jgi:cobyrinic acid a,c-diamide synthase